MAAELGLAAVALKDESDRLGLPAFKVLGASWAVERTLRERPDVRTLVTASAGNHGRAVAHVAALRGLRVPHLPARALGAGPARGDRGRGRRGGRDRRHLRGGGRRGRRGGRASRARSTLADVGDADPARWVIDGYQTLFAETAEQGRFDVMLVPVGAGSLAAAAARYGAARRHRRSSASSRRPPPA